ncbi:MAG: ATP-binding protein [Bacillota bacterium]|nr:ATP-binding protein [Bacillota bacterium]
MRRLTFLTGYFGSGKSEIAVNLAIHDKVKYLVDLDVINPYFRSREADTPLRDAGVTVISSPLKDAIYADMPYLSKDVFKPFFDPSVQAVFDLGGNDLGATLLRQYRDLAAAEPVDLFLVTNIYRDDTSTPESLIALIAAIEAAGGIKITGLINNANLLRDTTYEEIAAGEAVLTAVAAQTGLAIIYTCIQESIYDPAKKVAGTPLVLKLYLRKYWL